MPPKEKKTLRSAKDYGKAPTPRFSSPNASLEPESSKNSTKNRWTPRRPSQVQSPNGLASPRASPRDREDTVEFTDEAVEPKALGNTKSDTSADILEQTSNEGGWRPVVFGRKQKKPHGRPALDIPDNPDVIPRKRPEKSDNRNRRQPFPEAEPDQEEMNAHLSERIGNGKMDVTAEGTENDDWNRYLLPRHPLLSQFEREQPDQSSVWRSKPAIPSTEEVLHTEVALPANVINGPWPSVDEYLEAHYDLLREDAFSPLRDAVYNLRLNPNIDDTTEICIYDDVHIIGFTFSKIGIGVKCTFSLNRAHKKIRWTHSKRLIPGTLVVLTCDDFQNVKLATVLARPQAGLELNPPEIDLLFKDEEVEIDPTVSWIMVESRSSYFEAYKHTLVALQRINENNFLLHDHIVGLKKEIPPPQYLENDPFMALNAIFPDAVDQQRLRKVNVLDDWPRVKETTMDKSQLAALKRIITKRLAIVQGPPGTGKTYTSTMALKAMIKSLKEIDPPIIVACQTNHALDQILRKILEFEEEIVRMGARSQDREIKERTIYEKRLKSPIRIKGSEFTRIRGEMERLTKGMIELLEPLSSDIMTPEDLFKLGLISQGQMNAFAQREKEWQSVQVDDGPNGVIASWLEGSIYPFEVDQGRYDEMEDEDIDSEQLQELEAEFRGDDEFDDSLKGKFFSCKRSFKIHAPDGIDDSEISEYLKNDKVWDWPEHIRAAVYRHLEQTAAKTILGKFKELHTRYMKLVLDLKIARMEKDAYILQQAKVVGLTTTGLAKYRSLIASLSPKVVMIEEAAETLEGPLITACYPTVEHLILVGDHKQLRGHCNVKELEEGPYWLTVSMFERLVNNGIGFDTLKTQRRMRPNMKLLLKTIYPELQDHDSVLQRPRVEGMGMIDLFFYCHSEEEGVDDATSRLNHHEAHMITNFTLYLNYNKINLEDITILTFYSGQKHLLLQLLRNNIELKTQGKLPRVATVDSFQGEENEIVILSLVRSNLHNKIGFLSVDNRVCVALSRARRGFYIFGNLGMVSGVSELWLDVGLVFQQLKRLGKKLPLTCKKHGVTIGIQYPHDWTGNRGGCHNPCGEIMPCSHPCQLRCHPFDHSEIRCYEKCLRVLPCGHDCERDCWRPCFCRICKTDDEEKEFDCKWVERVNDGLVGVPLFGIRDTDNDIILRRPGLSKARDSATLDIRNQDTLPSDFDDGPPISKETKPTNSRPVRPVPRASLNPAPTADAKPPVTRNPADKITSNRRRTKEMLPIVQQRKETNARIPEPVATEELLVDFGIDNPINSSAPAVASPQIDPFSGSAIISPDECSWDDPAPADTEWSWKQGSLMD